MSHPAFIALQLVIFIGLAVAHPGAALIAAAFGVLAFLVVTAIYR